MNVYFTTGRQNAPSTLLNLFNLRQLNLHKGVSFVEYPKNFEDADILLFMGYDPDIGLGRKMAPKAKIGVIDPRPNTISLAGGADFVLANGPEMSSMAMSAGFHSFIYPIYQFAPKRCDRDSSQKIIICYHGNMPHAAAMSPVVTEAIDRVQGVLHHKEIIVRYIYSIKTQGRIPAKYLPTVVKVEQFPWHEKVYEKELIEADIGIVPNFVPLRCPSLAEQLTRNTAQGATPSDWLVRFKPTSNFGRILSFAMHGIPVVADCYPSAASVIEHGVSGFLSMDTQSWFNSLLLLCSNEEFRKQCGKNLYASFMDKYSPNVINTNLIGFLNNILLTSQA
ncbi:MAG: hypothetical protein FWG53_03750 [Clostridiales bacterium]|nr:hypothetical protein [Clostridiales bacterium]